VKTKRPSDFIPSSALFEAAERVLGKAEPVSLAKAMRGRGRARIREEQYRLAMQHKARPANEAPVGDDAGDPPAA
jgi:hypothetical protein